MIKSIKNLISFILCASFLLSISSCDMFYYYDEHPEGYTGGLSGEPHSRRGLEIHWLETFEEAMDAIKHLEAAGNKISLNVISSYENEIVDAKYRFILDTHGSKRLKKGEQWYDRKQLHNIDIAYYGFLDKVTINELEYSYLEFYKIMRLGCVTEKKPDASAELSYMCETFETGYDTKIDRCYVVEKETSHSIARIFCGSIEDHWSELPADFHEEFPKTIVYIGEE